MSRLHKRFTLSTAAAALAVGLLDHGAVLAQTTSSIDIGPDFGITAVGSGTNADNSSSFIVSVVGSLGNASKSLTELNVVEQSLTAGGPGPLATNLHSTLVNAVARGNSVQNQIGVLPGPPAGGLVDGAGIISTQVERAGAVSAFADLNHITQHIEFVAPTSASASLSLNSILADSRYNSALSTIETAVPPPLQAPADPANWEDNGTVAVDVAGSLSVANTQITGFFDSPDSPDPDLRTASAVAANSTIALQAIGDVFFGGNFKLVGNSIGARSAGNVSDNSILLRDTIATADGTIEGDLAFRGTAVVYNLQNVDDTRDEDDDFLGEGINALLFGAIIRTQLASSSVDQDIAPLDSLAVLLSANTLSAATHLNSARNEIGFARTLVLDGTDTPLDLSLGEESILLHEQAAERDAAADYLIVSRQSANRREGFDPVAYARVTQSLIALELLTQASSISLELVDNSVSATARGNLNDNILTNTLAATGAGTPSVAATAAMLNWQWVSAPDIEATIVGDVLVLVRATIAAPTGSDLDQGVALLGDGNQISANALGNRGSNLLQLSAVDLALVLGTDGAGGPVGNAAAAVFSDRGATNDGDTLFASGGGAMVNYQVLDSAADTHGDNDFAEPSVRAIVGGVTIGLELTMTEPRDVDVAATYHVEANDNLIEARATGSSYAGQASLVGDASFSGSLGMLTNQINSDQSVSSIVSVSAISVSLDLDQLGDADLAGQIEVDGSRLLSVATINSSSQVAGVEAVVFEGGGWRSDYDPLDAASSLGGLIQGYEFNAFRVTRNTSRANAAIALMSDQVSDEGDALSTVSNSGVIVDLRGSDPVPLENQAVTLTGTTIATQSRFNDATNSIVLDIATLATVDQQGANEALLPIGGPLAGIVSYQGSGQGYELAPDEEPLPERESESTANVTGSGIEIRLPGGSHNAVEASGNLLASTAGANVVRNNIALDAVDLDSPLGVEPISAILENVNDTDYDLSVVASFYIANTQRNEFQLFGGGPGPDVTAFIGGGSEIRIVSDEELIESTITLSNNALAAEARANVAENVIDLEAVSIESSAHIVSRQGNNGNVTSAIEDAAIVIELNAAPDGTDALELSAVTLENNTLQSLALGNAVLNDVAANALGSFQGVTGDPVVINEQLPATEGETTVEADYVILNRQDNSGTEEQPIEIASSVTGTTLSLTINGDFNGSTVTTANNGVLSQAVGNIAMNTVSVTAGGGDLPSAAVVNQQSNNYANVSATVSGNNLGVSLSGSGPGSTISAGAMGVSATAIGNSATNTMNSTTGAPGGNGS